MSYTHNLNIVLLDSQENIIENDSILDIVKKELMKHNTHQIECNGKLESFTITWQKIYLNNIGKCFMGDLCSYLTCNFDSIILQHTQKTISKIFNHKYIIRFYISKMIGDAKVSPGNYGGII